MYFDDLIRFNNTITEEREGYLREELKEIVVELGNIESELTDLNHQRIEALAVLKGTETFSKYHRLTARLTVIKADVETLVRKKEALQKLQALYKLLKMNVGR